ncbi:hypothetical protein [Amycolatopsis alkalitolerans]|uniref:Uncharacterized protein n=1 Tax=Amycolatopsis alkalitolerans TaxID=2547244 RepID=A0A5C4LWB3_9PSEU|nr:hypothetical protein [Amycolatopsis alkalitolerans]TNC23721.1 hypothetical protein FG385_20365 [Amycolatopsis alkalitolerans]
MKPTKRWTPLDQQTYRITWRDGNVWVLHATPAGKYPWLLTNDDGATQEIGVSGTVAAQAMAEFWLDVSSLYAPVAPTALRAAA